MDFHARCQCGRPAEFSHCNFPICELLQLLPRHCDRPRCDSLTAGCYSRPNSERICSGRFGEKEKKPWRLCDVRFARFSRARTDPFRYKAPKDRHCRGRAVTARGDDEPNERRLFLCGTSRLPATDLDGGPAVGWRAGRLHRSLQQAANGANV